MTDIVTDFADIAKRANLKALDGKPQDDVTAGIVKAAAPELEIDWHVYWQESLYSGLCQDHGLADCSVCP